MREEEAGPGNEENHGPDQCAGELADRGHSAPDDFLVATPHAGARVVSVTSGIGMTTAFGLAGTVLDELFS